MKKHSQEAIDVGLMKPSLRKRMGVEMASIFEEVGRAALEKAKERAVASVADEIAAFADDLAKRVRDTLGAKGITDAVDFIPTWAESVSTKALDHAYENISEAVVEGMKKHFPIGQEQEGQEKAAMLKIIYRGAIYVVALSREPYQRAMDRINDIISRGGDPVKGTLQRLNAAQDPGKIQGIWMAARELISKRKKEDWDLVASTAAKKYRDITGRKIA